MTLLSYKACKVLTCTILYGLLGLADMGVLDIKDGQNPTETVENGHFQH